MVDPDKTAGRGLLRNVLTSNGTDLPGSSVAAPWRDVFIVGSVCGDGFLVCEKNIAFEAALL